MHLFEDIYSDLTETSNVRDLMTRNCKDTHTYSDLSQASNVSFLIIRNNKDT